MRGARTLTTVMPRFQLMDRTGESPEPLELGRRLDDGARVVRAGGVEHHDGDALPGPAAARWPGAAPWRRRSRARPPPRSSRPRSVRAEGTIRGSAVMRPFTSVQISTRSGAERRAQERRGVVGAAAAQRGRRAVGRGPDEALGHRDPAGLEPAGRRHSRARTVSACICGVARPKRSSVSMIGRMSTHVAARPAPSSAAADQPAAPQLAPAGHRVELGRAGASGRAPRGAPGESRRRPPRSRQAPRLAPGSARAVAAWRSTQRGDRRVERRARRPRAPAARGRAARRSPWPARSRRPRAGPPRATGRSRPAARSPPRRPPRCRRTWRRSCGPVHPAFRHQQLRDLHRLARRAADGIVPQQHQPEVQDGAGAHPAHRHGHPAPALEVQPGLRPVGPQRPPRSAAWATRAGRRPAGSPGSRAATAMASSGVTRSRKPTETVSMWPSTVATRLVCALTANPAGRHARRGRACRGSCGSRARSSPPRPR